MVRLISAFLTVCVLAGSAMAAPCITAKDICTEWVNVGAGHDRVIVYRTFPLDSRNEAIIRALIVVHGAPRNADNYFRGATAAGFLAASLDDTVIISPISRRIAARGVTISSQRTRSTGHARDGAWAGMPMATARSAPMT
jgi:hypothetical protein